MKKAQAIQLIPYHADPLVTLSERLLEAHQGELPRLEKITILLPDMASAPHLRSRLLEGASRRGFDALLGPHITTLHGWLNDLPLPPILPVVGDKQRVLILVEALREHRILFGGGNLWALADTLLTLFDELTLNRVDLPSDLTAFKTAIAHGYGLKGSQPLPLDREARLIHTLWHAWHQQLHARQLLDQNSRTLLQLAYSLSHHTHGPLYMAGLPTLNSAEAQWLREMLQSDRITLLLQGEGGEIPQRCYHPQTPLTGLLSALGQPLPTVGARTAKNSLFDAIYQPAPNSHSLRDRAKAFADTHPHSPLVDAMRLFHADSDEQEACAVDLQVRRWLAAGHRQIGIVTENRRLARRVRALLERAGILLHDTAGWALSTTSAAAALEQLLQCAEEDFSHGAMLDLLKSPFIFANEERSEHLNTVYRLEQDIVLHENIGSGLERYQRQTRYRQHRLPAELARRLDAVTALLERIGEAVNPLTKLLSQGACRTSDLLEGLLDSLRKLGLSEGLANDAAGVQLLETLEQMLEAAHQEPLTISWLEFRGWLGRTLEQTNFHPPGQECTVTLIGLGQNQLQRFDALVIAGVEREFMPGAPVSSPFFNDAVRRELKLPTAEEGLAVRLFHFRRLLESSEHILLTLRQQQDGEAIIPSPWLELLRSFHLLAYRDNLEDTELGRMLHSADSQVVERSVPLPRGKTMPAPTLPASLLPRHYSASAYQQLVNCPYQFYAARGLRLAPPEAIREALEKSDYGERVHRILQAFHGGVAGLSGPFDGTLDTRSRADAQRLLETISMEVFAEDLEDNFLHRGWLQRWLEKIPDYLAWQIQREELGRVDAVELELRTEGFAPNLEIEGRLDRIDRLESTLAVVDYKTGAVPTEEEVLTGEAVQLPFYALLGQARQLPIEQVEYLVLEGIKPGSKVILQDEELAALRDASAERLIALQHEMSGAHGLPAWGDEKVCSYCQMEGLCRRGSWLEVESVTQ